MSICEHSTAMPQHIVSDSVLKFVKRQDEKCYAKIDANEIFLQAQCENAKCCVPIKSKKKQFACKISKSCDKSIKFCVIVWFLKRNFHHSKSNEKKICIKFSHTKE